MLISVRQCAEPLKLPINIKISDIPHPSPLSCHSFNNKMLHISDCLLAAGDYSCLSDCTLVQNYFFQKILSGTLFQCQTIWVQTVVKKFISRRQKLQLARKKLIVSLCLLSSYFLFRNCMAVQ